MSEDRAGPLVSILIVARNTGPFISAAIASARAQTWRNLEIVVVDDASTDDTRAIAERHAAEDDRVRVLDGPRAGLAAVRNTSLAAARGCYAAILDSDDLLHPEHVERLVKAALATGAEIVVANMVEFGDSGRGDGTRRVRLFAQGPDWSRARRIAAEEYLRGNTIGAEVVLGYLKPLFDLEFLRAYELCYDTDLRIGEDFDLVFRAILAGGRLHYLPEPGYLYRRHAASTSARTPTADLEAQIASDRRYRLPDSFPLLQAQARRRRSLEASLRTTRALADLKRLRLPGVVRCLDRDRLAWEGLRRSLTEAAFKRMMRLRGRRRNASAPIVLVIGSGTDCDERIAQLAAEGLSAVRVAEPDPCLADGLGEPAAVVLANSAARHSLPWAIAPAARVYGPDGNEVMADITL